MIFCKNNAVVEPAPQRRRRTARLRREKPVHRRRPERRDEGLGHDDAVPVARDGDDRAVLRENTLAPVRVPQRANRFRHTS